MLLKLELKAANNTHDISVSTRTITNPNAFTELNWVERTQLPDAAVNRRAAMIPIRLVNPNSVPFVGPSVESKPDLFMKVPGMPVPWVFKDAFAIQLMNAEGDVVRESMVAAPMDGLITPDGKMGLPPGGHSAAWSKHLLFDKTALPNHKPVIYDPAKGFVHPDDPWWLWIVWDPKQQTDSPGANLFIPVFMGAFEMAVLFNEPKEDIAAPVNP